MLIYMNGYGTDVPANVFCRCSVPFCAVRGRRPAVVSCSIRRYSVRYPGENASPGNALNRSTGLIKQELERQNKAVQKIFLKK